MKSYKIMAASLLAVSIVMPSLASAAPFDWEILHRDSTDSSDQTFNLTPPAYDAGSYALPVFAGTGSYATTTGTYYYLNVGSGFTVANNNNISVTPYSIETTDGYLNDTLGIIHGQIAALNPTSIATLNAFMTAANNNLYGASTTMTFANASTTNGLMTKVQNDKLAALSTTTFSGAYSDLTGKPTIGTAYEGTTTRTSAFPIFKSATVASGVAAVNLTTDGTSGGTALCTGGVVQDSVSVIFNDSSSSFQQSWAFSNSNKTLTVTANKFTSANILSGLLGQAAANGSVAKISVWCYA